MLAIQQLADLLARKHHAFFADFGRLQSQRMAQSRAHLYGLVNGGYQHCQVDHAHALRHIAERFALRTPDVDFGQKRIFLMRLPMTRRSQNVGPEKPRKAKMST